MVGINRIKLEELLEIKIVMRAIVLIGLLAVSFSALSFEGIIHCKKTENGVVTEFDFYVKGNRIAIISEAPDASYRIILDRNAQELRICMDHPAFDRKGYYLYTASTFEKRDSIKIIKQSTLASRSIDGVTCNGFALATDRGTASIFYGNESVDLTGFSTFFNDPVYELLDAIGSNKLPKLIVSESSLSKSTIELSSEAVSLDNSYFEVPAGYSQFSVGTISE